MAASVSLGRPLASICSIIPLCMESNVLEKSTNKSVVLVFLHELILKFDGLLKFLILWIDFSENYFGASKDFSQFQFQCGWETELCKSWTLWRYWLYLGSSCLFWGHLSWGKGGCILLSISLLFSGYIQRFSIGAVDRWICLSSIFLMVFHLDQLRSCFNFW